MVIFMLSTKFMRQGASKSWTPHGLFVRLGLMTKFTLYKVAAPYDKYKESKICSFLIEKVEKKEDGMGGLRHQIS